MLQAAAIAVVMATALVASAPAATFRWANDADSNSMDPYARQETFLLSMDGNMYEPLVRHDKDLKLEPALATEWSQTQPDVWRFKLRQGVKFHDGTPFTADDVVFSFDRVRAPGSNLATVVATVKEAKKVDDFTVDFVTNGPDPILPEEITVWDIMSKAWCEKNNAAKPADITKNEESYATNHENGTGPFVLKDREPDVKTVLVPNPNWWDKPEHNLGEVVFQRISNAATRVAALLSGELDMIYTVPPQDTDRIAKTQGLRILQKPELRTIYLGFDQDRPELLESNVKGKNPYKDKRVRQAFYQAIDEDAIKTKVMRGFATPTALMIGPGINGFDPTLNTRLPYDPAASKKLLAEAGYPDGFETGMDCPTDRYVNDEAICQAVVAMLAKVGIKVHLLAQTRAKYFAKILPPSYNTSFYMLGWTPATYDAHNMLLNLVESRDPATHAGEMNIGGYSNPEVDALIKKIQVETDKEKRLSEIHEALKIMRDDVAYIPLHQQAVVWAVRDNVDLVLQADNYFQLRYVKLK
jgi:peptide/nickel transport system substrate-binding protein